MRVTDAKTGSPSDDGTMTSASPAHSNNAAALRAQLMASGTWSLEDLSTRRGESTETTMRWLSARRPTAVRVVDQGEARYPRVQFDQAGNQRSVVAQCVRALLEAGHEPCFVWAWLSTPTGLLSGEIPLDVIDTQPERVRNAARRMASRTTS